MWLNSSKLSPERKFCACGDGESASRFLAFIFSIKSNASKRAPAYTVGRRTKVKSEGSSDEMAIFGKCTFHFWVEELIV